MGDENLLELENSLSRCLKKKFFKLNLIRSFNQNAKGLALRPFSFF